MAVHHLESTTETTVDVLSAQLPPVLRVHPGDTVVVHTLEAGGLLERPAPGVVPRQLIDGLRGHCLVGPIEVIGARPGDVLAVHFDELVPDLWGTTAAGLRDSPLNRRLGLSGESGGTRLDWDLDPARRTGTDQLGTTVALAPFLGVVGLPPAATGEHSTIPPRHDGAGNIDCRELVAGSTLYIPVTVAGAFLSVGDGHAAQGDGEVSGTAIETGMTTTMTLSIAGAPALPSVHAETPAGRVTFGFDADLNEAAATALDDMLSWMRQLFGWTKAEALATASVVVSMRVTQIANGTWGVHALLPSGAFVEG